MQIRSSTSSRIWRVLILFSWLIPGLNTHVEAQLNEGGLPFSYSHAIPSDEKMKIVFPAPDLLSLRKEDEKEPLPYRYAVNIQVDIDVNKLGYHTKASEGMEIWRLEVSIPGARALTLYFDHFSIPGDGKLFIYNPQRTRCLGAYTQRNNNSEKTFATSLIAGDCLVLEYNSKDMRVLPDLHISEIAYAYRGIQDSLKNTGDFGNAGACEVNINCSEGQPWQEQKRGVARISVKEGFSSFWCTGSLVNNVRNNRKPYFLTADHCGQGSSALDISQWIFYFNYEAAECQNPLIEPSSRTMVGARLIAHGGNGGETGSDFFLVLLRENIPDSFNVYYNGWNRSSDPSPSGAGIHHPEGDIQKISVYNVPLASSSWNGHPYQSHWKVTWAQTIHGHGVTEQGSSGSPIFDQTGHIVGTLTGGDSKCGGAYENLPDYYGKFSYSWDQNGTDSSSVLKYWLDPDNTGTIALNGQATSAENSPVISPLNVFPNPFIETIYLRVTSGTEQYSIGVFDQPGKCILSLSALSGNEPIKLNLQGLARGLYFLKLQGRTINAVVKIIKQ